MAPASASTATAAPTATAGAPPGARPVPLAVCYALPRVGPLTLVPATDTDFDVLRALHRSAMRPSVERLMGWDGDAQAERLRKHFAPSTLRFLMHRGTVVGCVDFIIREDDYFLSQFYLDPAWQGQGIGRALLDAMQRVARDADRPIRLKVLKQSAARRLYERVGFVLEGEDAWQDYLIWHPHAR